MLKVIPEKERSLCLTSWGREFVKDAKSRQKFNGYKFEMDEEEPLYLYEMPDGRNVAEFVRGGYLGLFYAISGGILIESLRQEDQERMVQEFLPAKGVA
jgi:hypothetical protein